MLAKDIMDKLDQDWEDLGVVEPHAQQEDPSSMQVVHLKSV